jgi:phosphoribosyl 1,2-cyclic phosphate phosphodiesterase
MPASAEGLRITVLGSGTSVGVPTVGCHCEVCHSVDSRDKRLRPSILVQYAGRNVLVDTTPDFRMQALRAGLRRLDAILFTHAHADHLMGLDDVRPINASQRAAIPVYGSPETVAAVRRCFCYAFDGKEKESSIPKLSIHELSGKPFDLFGMQIEPIPVWHGTQMIYGYRFGDAAAYITDQSDIPEESIEKLRGLDVLFLDALRHKPHPTHTTVEKALEFVTKIGPRRAFFTHICHELAHELTESTLPPHVRLAYDTLQVTAMRPAR